MWEFFIDIETGYEIYIKNLEKKLKQKFENCITAVCNNVLSIACELKIKNQVVEYIKRELAEIIILIYKQQELLKTLNLEYLSQELKNAFIKCLVLFDFDEDFFIIVNKLELEYGIVLKSFYNFKLKNLKTKWKQFSYVCSNNSVFFESQSFLDLLKYLIDYITPKHKSIDVYFDGNKFVLSDENNNILSFNDVDDNIEISLISQLISLAPKTINLHCAGILTNSTFKIIYYIFNKKINLLV